MKYRENDKTKIYSLLNQHDVVVCSGTFNKCFTELLRLQPHSVEYALMRGGWEIKVQRAKK